MGNDRNPLSPFTPLSEDNLNQSDSDGGLYIEKFEKKRKFRTSLYNCFKFILSMTFIEFILGKKLNGKSRVWYFVIL